MAVTRTTLNRRGGANNILVSANEWQDENSEFDDNNKGRFTHKYSGLSLVYFNLFE